MVIDAGSSSNKLHLFQWPQHDGDPSKLLAIKPLVDDLGKPFTMKVEPGKEWLVWGMGRGRGSRCITNIVNFNAQLCLVQLSASRWGLSNSWWGGDLIPRA